jgi:cellulose synthase/poly-beta-1,6-N-acetylglucosamine synthase-like glycosyltransferase
VLTDWTYWLSHKHPDELLTFLLPLLLTDGLRYGVGKIVMCLYDSACDVLAWLGGAPSEPAYTYCPSVCVVIAGHNEAAAIEATLASLGGTYPRLEVIVVDDGSTDGMADRARRWARGQPGVRVLVRPERGGKSSALNFALAYTAAEIVVVVDADSHLGPNALWEVVQPLRDPHVGAVAGSVLARNAFTNLVTWLQAYEYLSTIFVGRLLAYRLGILGIVSGAFGAFRRTALDRVQGWDVGPPEDLDLTLSLRKAGYAIAFAMHAVCYTDVPTTWGALLRQRLRWERSGVIRNHCRKHLDLACFWSPGFRLENFALVLESWLFNVVCLYGLGLWVVGFCLFPPGDWPHVLLTLAVCCLLFEGLQVLAVCHYSGHRVRDLLVCAVIVLLPPYQLLLLAVRLVATTEELLWRKSFADNYVPPKVRHATWRW